MHSPTSSALRRTLDRRTLLRGAGGIAVALPALEIMGSGSAHAAPPRRFVLSYGGISTGTSRDELVPDIVGPKYDVKRALKALADMNLRDDVSVVTGLLLPWSTTDAEPIPPGGRSRFFHFNTTGPQVAGTSTGITRSGRPRGLTADQIVANAIAGPTPHKVLAYRMQAAVGGSDSGSLSWRAGSNGTFVRQEPIASPRLAYQSLFAGFTAPAAGGGAVDEKRAQFLLKQRKSVLDFVRTEASTLLTRVGAADRVRVERHLEEIRGLEGRLTGLPATSAGKGCQQPPAPPEDPPIGPRGQYAWSGEDLRADVLTDLVAMAFTCDLSRVASFLLTEWKCWMHAQTFTGINSDMHELTHGAGPLSSVSDSVAFLVRQWCKLVAKLKAVPEVSGGSLLDQTALVLVFEGGHGYDPEGARSNSAHSTENMAALIAGGRAGGLKPGQHVSAKGKHPAQVVLSAMNAAGVMAPALGEVKGNLPELFT